MPLAGWPGEATEMFCVCKDPPGEEQERAKWKGRGHPRKAGQAWARKPLVCEVRLLGAPQTSMPGYSPVVLGGIPMFEAIRALLDASWGPRTELAVTGPPGK